MTQAFKTLLVLSLALVLGSCTAEPAPASAGLDETLACPEGFVGWNFRTAPTPTNTSLFQRNEEDAAITLTPHRSISLDRAVCKGNGRNITHWFDYSCNGLLSCEPYVHPQGGCEGEFEVEYSCFPDDEDPATGLPRVRTVTSAPGGALGFQRATVSCDLPVAEGESPAPRTACIPRFCHGQSHRDPLMNCVEEPDMPAVEPHIAWSAVREPYRGDGTCASSENCLDENGHRKLHVGSVQEIALWMTYDVEPPPNTRLSVWLADQWMPKGTTEAEPYAADSLYAYRCMATFVDLSTGVDYDDVPDSDPLKKFAPATGAVRQLVKKRVELSQECTRSSWYVKADAALNGGIWEDTLLEKYDNLGTRVFYSFDMESTTAMIPSGGTLADSCAANPPTFYRRRRFDRDTNRAYNMVEYLRQRELRSASVVGKSSPGYGFSYPNAVHVRTRDFKLDKAAISVSNLPLQGSALPVHVTFDEALRLGWRAVESTEYEARVYLWPADRKREVARYPEIGTIPLTKVDKGNGEFKPARSTPDGRTVSKTLTIPADVRSQFFDPGSPLYISPEQETRAFEVFYCVDSIPQRNDGDARQWFHPDAAGQTSSVVPVTLFPRTGGTFKNYIIVDEPDFQGPYQAFNPLGHGSYIPGCRFSSMPLMITADRFDLSTTPIANQSFSGAPSTTTSGSRKMSGESDNDVATTCTDTVQKSCTDASGHGMTGKGEMGFSYFDVSFGSTREADSKVSLNMKAEILGFQVIDPMGVGKAELAWPSGSRAETITISPQWDKIRDALNGGVPPGGVEWKSGNFAGMMGLGLGIGRKIPIQMGPIPGLITLTASAGVSLSLSASFQGAPQSGEEYPCVGASDCVKLESTPMSFDKASEYCQVRGGRLAELGSSTEGLQVDSAVPNTTQRYWVGGQLGYQHRNEQCKSNFLASQCLDGSKTSFRWLSTNDEFARGVGGNNAALASGMSHNVSPSSVLNTQIPRRAGVAFEGSTNKLYPTDMGTELPFACRYEHVDDTSFFKWGLSLNVGAAAGLGMSFCVPTDDPGICLLGSLNFIGANLSLAYTNQYFWLERGGVTYGRRGNTNLSVPWSVNILSGSIDVAVNFWFVSFSWQLIGFSGFQLAGGKLVDLNTPSFVDYRL